MAISPDQAMFSALDSGTSIMGLKIGRVRWNAESICLERGAIPSPQKGAHEHQNCGFWW